MQKMGKKLGIFIFHPKNAKMGIFRFKKIPPIFFSINAKIWDLGILITFLCAVLYLFQVIKIGQKHLENFLAFWETWSPQYFLTPFWFKMTHCAFSEKSKQKSFVRVLWQSDMACFPLTMCIVSNKVSIQKKLLLARRVSDTFFKNFSFARRRSACILELRY